MLHVVLTILCQIIWILVGTQAASFAWYAPFVVCIEFLNLIFGFFEAPDRPKGDSQ